MGAGPWVSYINRCQAMLQSGLFVADVLYYNGDWAPNLVGPRNETHNAGKGYDYDVCNAEVLLERVSVEDGKIVLPDGMSYRLLVLPDANRMPVEVAKKIKSLVKAGATVVGPKPVSDPGLKDHPNCDQVVSTIGDSLWGDLDGKDVVERKVGKGRVAFGESPSEILMADGIVPDIEIAGKEETYIDYIHRATADANLYFL
ncbi:MAG: glycosyl transferase family 2, partial [Chloroflexi bacterium]|nr:glycosyl transferase family 2 [Chloroflexota bacterium]